MTSQTSANPLAQPRTPVTDDGPGPLVNLRDLGGLPVAGGVVRPSTLWRSDDPTISPQDEISRLATQGLQAVLDLRSSQEAAASPHATATALGISAHHLPLAEAAVHPLAIVDIAHTMQSPRAVGHWYANLVRSHSHEVVQALEVISSPGGVLFHCAAGKDRTGILAGVLLSLLGADREAIAADYAQTQQNLTRVFERLRKASYVRTAPQDEADEDARRAAEFFASEHPLLTATEESMDSMITELGGAGGLADMIRGERDPDPLLEQLHRKLVTSRL